MLLLSTSMPIAIDSKDHLEPRGALDQQGHEGTEFFKELSKSSPNIRTVLDLGTGAGYFVYNGERLGYEVYGVEGTDKVDNESPWKKLKGKRLFHADLRFPFHFLHSEVLNLERTPTHEHFVLFDLITAWDVLEHMTEETIDVVMGNIKRHITSNGYFMGTIEFSDTNNEDYHTLCKPRDWWVSKFKEHGFKEQPFNPIVKLARSSPEENCFILRRQESLNGLD